MASTSCEASPSSPTGTSTINNSTKAKSKWSIRSLVANVKANFCVSKPKPPENKNNHRNAASSSATTNKNDDHGGALSLSSKLIQTDLLLLDLALMEYMHHTNEKINQAREKFKLLKSPSSETDHFDEVQRPIRKIEDQIPSLGNNHHNAASSSGTTNKDDNHGGALSHSSEIIQKHLLLLDSALMEYMHQTINQASKDFEELRLKSSSSVTDHFDKVRKAITKDFEELRLKSSSSETDHFDKVRKAITKLKGQIPSHRTSDSKSQHREWPNINRAEKGMMNFLYEEPEDEQTSDMEGQREAFRALSDEQTADMEGQREAFRALSEPLRCCLLCFFRFPPEEIVKRTMMIYLWIGQGYISQPDDGKKIFDELIAKNFIKRCSSVPNSCMMSRSVRSSLHKEAKAHGFTSNGAPDQNIANVCGCLAGNSCLINIGEAIINNELKIFGNVEDIRSLHLGRWQRSANHHIELEDNKILSKKSNILDGLKDLKSLTFLSLRGISMITELPATISELKKLAIFDLRACHNLEAIPKDIGLLDNLTHLDMSECYFLEHMPKSLAQLSNLEVLKGFFIGHVKNKKQSCTLHDLSKDSKLQKLRKLNIYTSVKEFPTMSDLDALRNFKGLLKLTISWGGCSLKEEKNDGMTTDSGAEEGLQTLHLRLQKLDLQGFPMKSLPRWLRPANLKELKKLYIRGGNLCNLGQLPDPGEQYWNVEILRLKYLSELVIDWSLLGLLFPELIYLQQLQCPKLTSFPVNESGVTDVWMDEKAIDTRFWLQKFFKSHGVSLSSLLGYGPNLAQDRF